MAHYSIIIFLLLLVYPSICLPDTHSAESCSQEDVQNAVTAASTGDTIAIPAGECTWTGTITIANTKTSLIIQGAGSTNTVITTETASSISLSEPNNTRITAIGFVMTGAATGQIIIAGGTGWRIDHCKFENTYGSSRVTIWIHGNNVSSTPYGLIDNNEFIEGRIITNMASNFAEGHALWSTGFEFGTANTVYIEDNTFYKTVSGGGNVIDAEDADAGTYVARYNTVTGNTSFMVHPFADSTSRGSMGWEIYGNSIVATNAATYTPLFIRSGTGFIFGNYFNNFSANGPVFDIWRVYTAVAGTSDTGLCDGGTNSRAVWDGDSANGYPCRDQIGRGKDDYLWTDGTPYPPQSTVMPVYMVFNRYGTVDGTIPTVTIANGADDYIVANRDYYNQVASFDGTTGTGCGTIASRPATCTTGVGYWATAQSCSDLTGMVGANPASPISGTLYKCTSTNTWTQYYVPYTYPHPLRGTGAAATLGSGPVATVGSGAVATIF